MSDCKGIFGRLFGHKMVTEYNVERSPGISPEQLKESLGVLLPLTAEGLIEASERYKETVALVYCARCGESITPSSTNT